MEGDDAAGRGEDDVLAGGRGAAEADRHRLADGVLHLRGDGAHPDQLVEPELLAGQARLGRGAERLARRADRLVRLLGVLDLGGVGARGVGEVLGAVELAHLRAGRVHGRARQRGAVGTHVGDVAVLVEPLGDRHGHAGGHAELAAGLLLQRGGAERRVRRAAVGLGLDRADVVRRVLERADQGLGARPVEVDDLALGAGLEHAVLAEVGATRDALVVDGVQLGGEHPLLVLGAGVEGALEVPVGGDLEGHPLLLAVHDQSRRHRLHPAGGQAGHDLLPQHRGDLVAVEAVEDAAGLLGLDEVHGELAGVLGCLEDRGLGDLVEDHPLDRDVLRLQLVEQVPGDRLPLAVLIGGEVELVGVLEQALELGDVRLLVTRHDVVGLEAVVDVDREPPPRLVLDLGRGVRGGVGEVADVTDGGLDDVALAEVPADGAGLGRGLDDDELVCHGAGRSFDRGVASRCCGPCPRGPRRRSR